MSFFTKTITKFATMKPFKIAAQESGSRIKFKSQTNGEQWEVSNALEALIASLVACEYGTLKILIEKQKFSIGKVNFTKIESLYDVSRFAKGGKENIISQINMNIQVETDGSQEQFDKFHEKVNSSCSIYQMLSQSGVKIKQNWEIVPLALK